MATPLTRRAGRAARPGRDEGTTLVELLTVMIIMGIVGPISLTVLVSVYRQTNVTLDSAVNSGSARIAVQYLDRQVRSGNPPLTVSATSLSLNTCADQAVPSDLGKVRVVEFRIADGALQTRSHLATGTAGTWRTLATGFTGASGFAASGTNGVLVTLTAAGGNGRPSVTETLLTARNVALPTPLPQVCP